MNFRGRKIPISSRTLKHTPRKCTSVSTSVREMGTGQYIYLGIENWIKKIIKTNNLEKLSNPLELT
jgi:hypothetical protein